MTEFLRLKKSNCKNCYKCIRHCPVKSIRFSGNQAHIVGDECVLCGQCFVVCPQNAKEIRSDTEKAKVLISQNSTVIASLAPSFVANYGVGITAMASALKKLGFTAAEETAIGATMVKNEYVKIARAGTQEVIITSCCPSVNLMIEKYYPEALPCLARVMTPMEAHCADIKKRMPDAKTVFIGPCISKKAEAERMDTHVDCTLTFEELSQWMDEAGVVIEDIPDTAEAGRARLFPTSGGILKSMTDKPDTYTYLAIDGAENCISALKDIISGNIRHCFIEMSACYGSCICGPVMEKHHFSPVGSHLAVDHYAGTSDFTLTMPDSHEIECEHKYSLTSRQMPGSAAIQEILRKMGKAKPEDELNCGSCGYDTCRDKAVAIYQGKADLSMCLPYLRDKAESFSDNIIRNTPNAIIVLNEALEVQQVNKAALTIMNLRSESDVLGEQVIRILDPKPFLDVMHTGAGQRDVKVYLAEYKKYVEQTILYDQSYHIIICLMKDITVEEQERERKEQFSRNTVEVADRVVEKQMRVVQEIASLLGETAAETKIALTKLKESLGDE